MMKLQDEQGFTMVELLIYSALLVVVIGAAYSILITNTKSYSSQENRVEMTQGVRASMELLVTEIRMAGCDPTGAGGIGFLDGANDNYDTDGNSVHFTMDTDSDGAIANSEDINYYRKTTGGVQQLIRRTGAGGEPVMAENITNLSFSYRFSDDDVGVPDETDGDSTNDLDDIRSVQITLSGETGQADPLSGATKARTQTSWVLVRNAGL
jgi:type IV pilus assembly protein PilW